MKKIILTGLIAFLGTLTIVNGGYIRKVGTYGYSPYDNSFDINAIDRGTLLTQKLGITKNIIYLIDQNNQKSFFFRDENNLPYIYIYYIGRTTQGEIKSYSICDEITEETTQVQNCSNNNVGQDTRQVFGNFFSNVKNTDRRYFDVTTFQSNTTTRISSNYCFSSKQLSRSICFGAEAGTNGNTQLENLYGFNNDVSFDNLQTSYLNPSPGTLGGNNTEGTTNTPVNNYVCPTIQQLINGYGSQYNTGLCYSSSLIYSGGQVQTVTPKSIFTLYPQYTNFAQDINTYNSYCTLANSQQACQTMFEGKTEQYTLIAKIPNTVQPMQLYQYCHLQLDYPDKNATTCVASGVNQTGSNSVGNIPITSEDIINQITNNNYTIILPGGTQQSGNSQETNGDGIYNDIVDLANANGRDIIQSLNSMYTKITSIFKRRTMYTEGIIPNYITWILLLIVLFKLFKK